jgi:hypothetical protein
VKSLKGCDCTKITYASVLNGRKNGPGLSIKKKVVCSVLFAKNMVNHQYKHVEHGFSAQSLTGSKLEKSEWHKVAFEKHMLAEAAAKHGYILQRMARVSEEDKRRNLELVKKLVRSLYFLVKHRMHACMHATHDHLH